MLLHTSKKDVNMLSGSIMKALWQISIPIMIMNVAINLFNIVDMTVLRIFAAENTFAVGALISWVLMVTLGLRALLKNESATKLKLSRLRFYGPELKEILKLEMPQ